MKIGLEKEKIKKVRREAEKIKRRLKEIKYQGYIENIGEDELRKFREKFSDCQFYEEFERIYDDLDNFIMNL